MGGGHLIGSSLPKILFRRFSLRASADFSPFARAYVSTTLKKSAFSGGRRRLRFKTTWAMAPLLAPAPKRNVVRTDLPLMINSLELERLSRGRPVVATARDW